MKALVLVAHGSRRAASNDEVRQIAGRLAEAAGDRFGHVGCGFLELAEPSIPDAVQQGVDAGADEVIVLPYFLSAGRHVAEDIPAEVRIKQDEHPGLNIRIAPYFGSMGGVVELLLDGVV